MGKTVEDGLNSSLTMTVLDDADLLPLPSAGVDEGVSFAEAAAACALARLMVLYD